MNPARIGGQRKISSDGMTTHEIGMIKTTPPNMTKENGGTRTGKGTTTNAEIRTTDGEIIIAEMSVGNVDEMQEHAKQEETTEITNNDPSWQPLQQCQIMLPLSRLLQLVPQFTENQKSA